MRLNVRLAVMTVGAVGCGVLAIVGHVSGNPRQFILCFAGMLGFMLLLGDRREYGRFWRGESPRSRRLEPPEWWPYSTALWHGNLRSSTVVAVAALPMFGLGLLVLTVNELGWPAPPEQLWWYPLLRLAAIAVWIVGPGLGVSIILFNAPRALVPPHLRDQPGLLASRRDRHES